ncbi:MAG TPA: DDE-type integrase/transposase/recombinase [Thermoplasmata archaeon]|jgi:transposase-like protein
MAATEPWKDARTPALAIVARGDQIESVAPRVYMVRSQSHPETVYRVRCERGRWTCECRFHIETEGSACVHILAVKFREGFGETAKTLPEPKQSCPSCRSGNVVGDGKRLNKSGAVSKFKCRACGACFSGREGFHNRRSDPEMIAKALDLYFRGVSFRQVAQHFAQAYGLKLSPMTVYRWVTHYSALAAEWMAKQGANVGETWHVDERVVNVNGEHAYLWNVMDSDTRFLLASRISKGRGVPEARAAFQEAKAGTEVRPMEIRSDGLAVYPEAIKKEFMRRRLPTDPPRDMKHAHFSYFTPHRVVPSIRAPESNNILERLNGTSKDRTKTMRAYDNEDGAEALSLGWKVHYNMIRDHLALGTTPGVAAGIAPLPGFRWRAILDLAVRREIEAAPGAD